MTKSDDERCRKPLLIGLSIAPTWLSGEAWRRQDSEIERLLDIDHACELARRAEAAKLDFLFRPDALCLDISAVQTNPANIGHDPAVLMACLARETSKIGLVTTVSSTFAEPYIVARQIQSLNWISKGRIGINIVTSIEGNENFGLDEMPPSQQRYERAAEFNQLIHELWQSFPEDAVVADRESGQYAQVDRVSNTAHHGSYFDVEGALNIPEAGFGPIPIFQAGASEWGRNFAASVAHGIFAACPDMDALHSLHADLKQRAQKKNRCPADVNILPGLHFYLGETDEQAQELYHATHCQQVRASHFDKLKSILGVDLSHKPLDETVTLADLPEPDVQTRSLTHSNLLCDYVGRERPSMKALLSRPEIRHSAHWLEVGSPQTVFEAILYRAKTIGFDGFIALPGGGPQSLDLFLNELMPMLREAGLAREDYIGSSLMDHLKDGQNIQNHSIIA